MQAVDNAIKSLLRRKTNGSVKQAAKGTGVQSRALVLTSILVRFGTRG